MYYGSTGTTIGHEMTHGFDDAGKNYDEQRNWRNWWTEKTLHRYSEKTQCMIDQYSSIEVEKTGRMFINGELTSKKNIADNGEIRESYKEYKKFAALNGPDKTLPGIDASPDKLFFYGFANSWCSCDSPSF